METRIGPHRITVQDDVLTAYVSNPWQLGEMTEFLELCQKTRQRLGSAYIITVVGGPSYHVSPEARKYIAEWSRVNTLTGNVVAGAPFAMRTLIGIIARAAKIIGAKTPEVTFTATEAEARAWVEQRKQQQRPAASSP